MDTFRRLPGDASYDAAVALRAELESRRDDEDSQNDLTADEQLLLGRLADSLDDTDTGDYELLVYRSTSANANDGIDTIRGRGGIDRINGGPGDDYSLQLDLAGMATVSEAATWGGTYRITDRGGDAWTVVVNYGDGTAPVTLYPAADSVGSLLPLSHVYGDNGQYVITVTVTSDDGLQQTSTLPVTVSNVAPNAALNGPSNGVTGTPVVLTVSASDPAGAADPLTYAWTVTRNGSPFATQTGGTSYSLNAALPGSYQVTVVVNDGDGGLVERSRVVEIASPVTPAQVASVVIDDGTDQRSMVRSLTITFDRIVTIQNGAFAVTRRGAGGGPVTLNTPQITSTSGRTVVRLTFAALPGSSLTDGNYELTINATRVRSDGLDLDGDANGTAGGNLRFGDQPGHRFFRLFGDGNGDRIVNAIDVGMFNNTYRRRAGMAGFNSIFDSDSDGDVDVTDYAFMRDQINKTMNFL